MAAEHNETHLIRYDDRQVSEYLTTLNKWIAGKTPDSPVTLYYDIAGVTVRILIYDPSFLQTVLSYLEISLTEPEPYDYTVLLWKTEKTSYAAQGTFRVLRCGPSVSEKVITFYEDGNVLGFDKTSRTFYCGYPNTDKYYLTSWGDPLLKQFHKIFDRKDTALVHGACIGIDGKGVLICARGEGGKSTLAVSSLISGFDFVADDYLVIKKNGDTLSVSPVYSTAKLSYEMFERMREKLAGSPIVADIHRGGKYVINLSSFNDRFRREYPVRICLTPQIVPGIREPAISMCSEEERGAAIVHIVHSTISQLTDGRDNAYNLKLTQMFRKQIFYKISISPDIYANVECLRSFLNNL